MGEWRRRRFLSRAGLPSTGNGTASICTDLADLADLDERWKEQRRSAARSGKPAILALENARASQASDWGEFQRVLRHVRGWALTCLSARRIPPNPALFDLVIIDEASQCSIPAVVPLLFQAERALIIGDVRQLPHISTLPARRDAELRRTRKLTSEWLDEHRMSVRRHSSFHAAERAAGGSLLLNEHYRCHPEIAAVSNEHFYGGRLTVLTDIRGRPTVKRPAVS